MAFVEVQKYEISNERKNIFPNEINLAISSSVQTCDDVIVPMDDFYEIGNPIISPTDSDEDPNTIPGNNTEEKVKENQSCEAFKSDHHSSLEELVPCTNLIVNPVVSNVMQLNNLTKYEPWERLDLSFQSDDSQKIVLDKSLMISSISNMPTTCRAVSTCESVNMNGNKVDIKEISCEELSSINKAQNTMIKVYRGRNNCSKNICQAVNNSLEFCRWLQRNRTVHRFLDGAKSSVNNLMNMLDLRFKSMFVEGEIKLMIVAEKLHSRAIEKAFSANFHCQVSSIDLKLDTVPVLPIGHQAGVRTAEMKIECARRYDGEAVIISTSTLLFQAISQRWQMTTAICLDDPKLQLRLQNFTVTTPIPNEYVAAAEQWTPEMYHSRELGLAVSVEQAIHYLTGMETEDTQKFLTDINTYATLQSAALNLAGMYKKYVNGIR